MKHQVVKTEAGGVNLLGAEQSTDKGGKKTTFPVSVVCSIRLTLALTLMLSPAAPLFPDPLFYLDYLSCPRGVGLQRLDSGILMRDSKGARLGRVELPKARGS